MNIQFQKSDASYIGIEELRKKIATQACMDPNFIEIVCDILLQIRKQTNDLTYKLGKALDIAQYKISDDHLDSYKSLKELLCDYYILIQDFGFDSELRAYNPDEYKYYRLSEADNKRAVFRGLLFEAIVEELVKERFKDQEFHTGCKVLINERLILIHYGNGRTKQTFDIAGWHLEKQYGEFYECKIQPDKFKAENYQLMLKLEKILDQNKIENYKLIGVSANSESMFQSQIQVLEEDMTDKMKKFKIYGKDTLNRISAIELPESA